MLKKYINSILFFSRLNFRNPLYITSVSFGTFYLGLMVYTYSSSEITSPGNMLQLSSFLIQGYMLVFMFLGYYSINLETDKTAKDLFLTIPKSYYIKIMSNYLFILISNVLFCFFSVLLFLLVYKFSGYEYSEFYTKSIYFIFIYWFMPAIISSLIGVVIGIWINKKISFSILLGAWLLLSPMNVYFSDQLFRLLGFEYVPGFLHLGIPNPKMSYHAFSGFVFTKEDLINKVVWVILLLLLTLFLLILKTQKLKSIKTITSLLIICSLFITATHFIYMDSKLNPTKYNQRNIDELNYYAETEQKHITTGLDYDIAKYDIKLNITKKLTAAVQISLRDKEQGIKYFTLYHGFDVTNIEDSMGNSIDYQQYGDFLKIQLKQPTKQLKIEYSGLSSPFMDANQHYAYLPFYFAWIPLKSGYPSMKYIYSSNHRLPIQPHESIDYVLHYKGNNEVLTNLREIGNGKYVGTKETGISLMYGELKTKKIKKYKVTYPITWENSIATVNSYLEQLEETFETIQTVFKLEKQKLPRNILFIPARGPNDTLPSESMWYQQGEQLTVLIDPYEHHDETTFKNKEYLISYQMVGALLWKNKGIVYKNEEIPTVFNALAGDYINQNLGVKELYFSEKDYWIGEVLLHASKKNKEIIQELSSFTASKSEQIVESFFLDWNKLLQNPNVTWDEVDKLLKAYK